LKPEQEVLTVPKRLSVGGFNRLAQRLGESRRFSMS
jgi:hypothetical protein